MSRAFRLSALSAALHSHAMALARQGHTSRAMRATAIAEALHHEAGGDRDAARDALADAVFYRRAEKRRQAVPA